MSEVIETGQPSHRGWIMAALMVSTGLAALDATIVATAAPSIVGDLGGFAHFPWLFSIYLLTQLPQRPGALPSAGLFPLTLAFTRTIPRNDVCLMPTPISAEKKHPTTAS